MCLLLCFCAIILPRHALLCSLKFKKKKLSFRWDTIYGTCNLQRYGDHEIKQRDSDRKGVGLKIKGIPFIKRYTYACDTRDAFPD